MKPWMMLSASVTSWKFFSSCRFNANKVSDLGLVHCCCDDITEGASFARYSQLDIKENYDFVMGLF